MIEFYWTRGVADEGHAVIGRKAVPPNSMTITDVNGKMHYSGIIGSEAVNDRGQ